jgi:hypothetical protein
MLPVEMDSTFQYRRRFGETAVAGWNKVLYRWHRIKRAGRIFRVREKVPSAAAFIDYTPNQTGASRRNK